MAVCHRRGLSTKRRAEGRELCSEFVHKVRIATKELRETLYWLRVLGQSDWLEPTATKRLLDEVDQLVAILITSARTAKSRNL